MVYTISSGVVSTELLFGGKIRLDQVHLPSEQEDWQDPDKNK